MQTMEHQENDYAELQVTTNFSFLRGASHPDELVLAAKEAGITTIAVTDRNTVAGIVRAHIAARRAGMRLVVGCRLDIEDAPSLLCYPRDRAAYGRLCQLLTIGKRRAEKGQCRILLSDVRSYAAGQIFIVVPPRRLETAFKDALCNVANVLEARRTEAVYLAAHHCYQGDDAERLARLEALAQAARTPIVATGDILYHDPERRQLQDVLTCIREKCRIDTAGLRLEKNAERHIKSPREIARLFKGRDYALARTRMIADACRFSLDELRYEYPDEPVPEGKAPQRHLEELTWQGARWRYPEGIPPKVHATLVKELALITELSYAPYFLTVYDIVQYARNLDPPILCQGRGSAANSAVCFCLGITSVDPNKIDLLVERFISRERDEPPDIDIDFEHERREEVIQYIYERYGRERAGIAATIITYRSRSAVREVGKVMGLSEDVTGALAGTIWGSSRDALQEKRIREAGLDLKDPLLARVIKLTEDLIGFPRHLSQHVGGFILTRGPLTEVVPVGNAAMADRTFIEWDKDDIDALGILKVDVLALGMLSCIRKCFELLGAHYGRELTLATVPQQDAAVYDMLCRADTIGVFQIESRAQMSMLPRLKPREFYDLVIEIAIVRPGPIQGNMVHPYLRRRNGEEPVDIPSPKHGDPDELKRILNKTLGVPLFQEQAMSLAMVAAEFSSGELNELRQAMATFRRRGTIQKLEEKMVGRMVARGYEAAFAQRCFDQIKGFAEYGFPESHSASFALLAYVSSWLKYHYPDVFACGLLNAQPMGFYAPAQIVRDAREHDVEIRPVDVNYSDWDNTLEPAASESAHTGRRFAVRLGMRQIDGMVQGEAEKIIAARWDRFPDIETLRLRSGISVATLKRLADADAFRSIGLDRREALWRVHGLSHKESLPLFAAAEAAEYGQETEAALPRMGLPEHVVADYQTLRLSLKAHPMALLRSHFSHMKVATSSRLPNIRNGAFVTVAGLVLVRQRPGTARGVVFITLEDETGVANAVVWPQIMERYRKVIMTSRLLLIRGPIQSHDGVIHIVARHLEDCSDKLNLLANGDLSGGKNVDLANAENIRYGVTQSTVRRHPRDVRVIPKSRDFH